jgi:hypothetical protein
MSRAVEVHTPLEALLVEQALLLARELQVAADGAPDGLVLERAEGTALTAGREFTRRALEAVLQEQAAGAEKKTRRGGPVSAGTRRTSRTRSPRPPSPPPVA